MSDRVRELMARAYELPYGEARTLLTEEALRHAEASGDESLALQVRMGLTTAYHYGGEIAKTFTTFSRCLADFDRIGADANGKIVAPEITRYGIRLQGGLECTANIAYGSSSLDNWYAPEPR